MQLFYPKMILIIALIYSGVATIYDDNFFKLLNTFVCIISLLNVYQYYQQKKQVPIWIFLIIGVIFNPLVNFEFYTSDWRIIDWLVALIFLIDIFREKMPDGFGNKGKKLLNKIKLVLLANSRINRKRYAIYFVLSFILAFMMLVIFDFGERKLGFRSSILSDYFGPGYLMAMPFWMLLFVWGKLMVLRLHDLNESYKAVLIFPISFILIFASAIGIVGKMVGIIGGIGLFTLGSIVLSGVFFIKGTSGINRYGADPIEYSNYVDYLKANKK